MAQEKNFLVMKLNKDSKEEVLRSMASQMESEGFVKDTYAQAVCDREVVFPTGLPTKGVGVAIPHTDSIHVNKKAISLGILEKPVEFTVMGTEDETVEVGLVFMLAIINPDEQVEMLQKLIGICQDEETLMTLKNSDDEEKINSIIGGLL